MRAEIARHGAASKLVDGETGRELLRVSRYPGNGLLVASRYTRTPDNCWRHLHTFVSTSDALIALFGRDGWQAERPGRQAISGAA